MAGHLDQILVCKVSKKWYDILSTQYDISGSNVANCWRALNKCLSDEFLDLAPGSLVMFIAELGLDEFKYKIVGGGFFTGWSNFKADDCWDVFGLRTGAVSYDDFLNDVKTETGSDDANINSVILSSSFFFDKNVCVNVPVELNSNFDDDFRFIFDSKDPIARYLRTLVLRAREPLVEKYGMNWPGMYFMASHSHSSTYQAAFVARVEAAYNGKCAISGTAVKPVLEVAHIQPFFDDQFQSPQNGILLRSDLRKLFSGGYLTLDYRAVNDIRVVVSQKFKSVWHDEYMNFHGKKIALPDDINLRPLQSYILWHQEHCFEYWMTPEGSHM